MPGSPQRPLQARARRTRASLLQAAAEAFSARGYAAATSKSIADAAGVATGSFYQYFDNKDAVLRELARERFEAIQEHALAVLPEPDPEDLPRRIRAALVAIVELVVALHRDDPGLHAVLTERRHLDPGLDELTTAFEQDLVERIEGWLATWGHQGDLAATAFVLFGMLEGAVHSHVLGESRISDERFGSALVDALAAIILPRGGGPAS